MREGKWNFRQTNKERRISEELGLSRTTAYRKRFQFRGRDKFKKGTDLHKNGGNLHKNRSNKNGGNLHKKREREGRI